jgi:hypothetical protein
MGGTVTLANAVASTPKDLYCLNRVSNESRSSISAAEAGLGIVMLKKAFGTDGEGTVYTIPSGVGSSVGINC